MVKWLIVGGEWKLSAAPTFILALLDLDLLRGRAGKPTKL